APVPRDPNAKENVCAFTPCAINRAPRHDNTAMTDSFCMNTSWYLVGRSSISLARVERRRRELGDARGVRRGRIGTERSEHLLCARGRLNHGMSDPGKAGTLELVSVGAAARPVLAGVTASKVPDTSASSQSPQPDAPASRMAVNTTPPGLGPLLTEPPAASSARWHFVQPLSPPRVG